MPQDIDIIQVMAKDFKIPFIDNESRIWFFRTQSGKFYFDFYINKYITLGWNLVSRDLIRDSRRTFDAKKTIISDLYPEENRPGLILGQMDSFYNKMHSGDLIVIPAYGGKTVAIGTLGDVISDIQHQPTGEEYDCCEYKHKRSVKWLKEIDWWTDVYLFRVFRAQQTMSDITDYADLVYRNLYPCYITEHGLHLTLQKKTEAEFRIRDNIDLQRSILQIHSTFSKYYDVDDVSEKITIKTAVGSPGFIELVLPYVPASVLTGVVVYRGIVGKTKSSDGEENTGMMAILSKGDELLNNHSERKKTKAEIKQIEANTTKILAEASLVEAQTRKANAEAEAMEIENEKAKAAASSLVESTRTLRAATVQSGISFDKKLDDVS